VQDAASATLAFWEQYNLDIKTPDIWGNHVPLDDPGRWKKSVVAQLQILSRSAAGYALLQSQKKTGRWIVVYPLKTDECNAHGYFVPHTKEGDRWYGGHLKYNPDVFMDGSACYKRRRRSFGHAPDQVLFHELIHAHRSASSLSPSHDKLLAGLSGYWNGEEFLSVVLTNIYISETRGTGMRADYLSYGELTGPLSSSIGFFASSPQVLTILTRFSKDQEFLFNELAKVKAAFNPLAALKFHRAAVEKVSSSKASLQRDKSPTIPGAAAANRQQRIDDARHRKEQDAKLLQTKLNELAQRNLQKDLAGLLAEAALVFLPK
jgi:hypothetical protein